MEKLEGLIQIWALRKGDYKYIYYRKNADSNNPGFVYDLFFDLQKDNREYVDVKSSNADKVKELKSEMFPIIKHINETSVKAESLKIDRETNNQLRALGYMN